MDREVLFGELRKHMSNHAGLKLSKDEIDQCEFIGTFPVQQGRQTKAGHYFASLIIKPKDLRFYFFPVYTHKEAMPLPEKLRSYLKGKSCFHLKNLEKDQVTSIKEMIDQGYQLYKKQGLL